MGSHKTSLVADPKPGVLSATEILAQPRTRSWLFQRVWLPRLIYEALPYAYLLAGLGAYFATLYVPEWYWVVPYYFLLACLLIHAGVHVWMRRLRARNFDT